jgi:hypothetical protein
VAFFYKGAGRLGMTSSFDVQPNAVLLMVVYIHFSPISLQSKVTPHFHSGMKCQMCIWGDALGVLGSDLQDVEQ